MILDDNYYTNLIEETCFEIDQLFMHENIFLTESEGESIIQKIVRKIKEAIEWIAAKIREIRNNIRKFAADKMFQAKCMTINTDKLSNKNYTFIYFNCDSIYNDYNSNLNKLIRETEEFDRYYGKFLKTFKYEDLDTDKLMNDPYNYSTWKIAEEKNSQASNFGGIKNKLDPFIGKAGAKITFNIVNGFKEERDEKYVSYLDLTLNEVKDIIEKGKKGEDPVKILRIPKIDIEFAEKNNLKIKKECSRFYRIHEFNFRIADTKKYINDHRKNSSNNITNDEINALRYIIKNILYEYWDALDVNRLLLLNCNELIIYKNFFNMIKGESLKSKSVNMYYK